MFIGIGVAALLAARDYPLGAAVRMGPGFFPTWVGAITALLGALIALRSLRLEGPSVTPFAWRALAPLALGFAFFGWAIERLGLVASLAVLIVLSALAGREFRVREVAILAAVLIGLCWALFIYALGLPLRPWW
jgi:putative tricarboxylic transport membrane protein